MPRRRLPDGRFSYSADLRTVVRIAERVNDQLIVLTRAEERTEPERVTLCAMTIGAMVAGLLDDFGEDADVIGARHQQCAVQSRHTLADHPQG